MRIGVYGGRTNRELITRRLFGTYKRECEDGCTSLCTYIRFWKWRFGCWFGSFFLRFFSLLPCCPLPLLSLLPLERWRANLSYNVRVIIMQGLVHLYSLVSFYFFLYNVSLGIYLFFLDLSWIERGHCIMQCLVNQELIRNIYFFLFFVRQLPEI